MMRNDKCVRDWLCRAHNGPVHYNVGDIMTNYAAKLLIEKLAFVSIGTQYSEQLDGWLRTLMIMIIT